jgi:hypothetical protein
MEQLQRKGWMGSGQKIKRQKYCELLCGNTSIVIYVRFFVANENSAK